MHICRVMLAIMQNVANKSVLSSHLGDIMSCKNDVMSQTVKRKNTAKNTRKPCHVV